MSALPFDCEQGIDLHSFFIPSAWHNALNRTGTYYMFIKEIDKLMMKMIDKTSFL